MQINPIVLPIFLLKENGKCTLIFTEFGYLLSRSFFISCSNFNFHMTKVDKNSRQECYFARDAYFSCLDRNQIISTRQPTIDELMSSPNNPFYRQKALYASKVKKNDKDAPLKPEDRQLPSECQSLLQGFRAHCISSWVVNNSCFTSNACDCRLHILKL